MYWIKNYVIGMLIIASFIFAPTLLPQAEAVPVRFSGGEARLIAGDDDDGRKGGRHFRRHFRHGGRSHFYWRGYGPSYRYRHYYGPRYRYYHRPYRNYYDNQYPHYYHRGGVHLRFKL